MQDLFERAYRWKYNTEPEIEHDLIICLLTGEMPEYVIEYLNKDVHTQPPQK